MLKPNIAKPLFSSSKVSTLNDIHRDLAGHITWEALREIEKSLYRFGIGFSLLSNEKMSVQLVSRYLNIKQKQML